MLVASVMVASTLMSPCRIEELGRDGECGRIAVPLQWNGNPTPTITLNVVVAHAPSPPVAALPPIVAISGGPGAPTASAPAGWRTLADWFPERDLILIDQRGTGGSGALACGAVDAGAVDDTAALFGNVFSAAELHACVERWSDTVDLRWFRTHDAVADLDAVRAALGHERVVPWGVSYGTRVAQHYARTHPGRVDAIVLDSVVPFDLRAPASYAATLDTAFAAYAARCAARAACSDAYGDLNAHAADAVAALAAGARPAKVIAPRSGRPVVVHVDRADFGYAVRGMLYRGERDERLPRALRAAAIGDFAPAAQAYVDLLAGRAGFSTGLHFSTLCAEDVRDIGPADIEAARASGLLTDRLIREMVTVCAGWPGATPPDGFGEPLASDVPALLLSGNLDPVTPAAFATAVHALLPNGIHLVADGAGHGVTAARASDPCLRRVTRAFVGTGVVDRRLLGCWRGAVD